MDSGRGVSRGRAAWWRWGAALALLLGLLGGGLPAAGVARAAGDVTITVTSVADATGGGGGCTLRDAIAVANAPGTPVGDCAAAAAAGGSGTTLAFALPGAGPWAITLGSALPPIGVPLTLRGPGAALLTIRRDAAATPPPPAFRLLESGSDLTVAGVTLTGGDAGGGSGGGFYAAGAATVTDSTLSGNSAGYEGGGFYAFGAATVTDSTLSGNSAHVGGGFYAYGAATVTGSTLSGNGADAGGGFYAGNGATVTVTGSTLSGNTGGVFGGGFRSTRAATVTGSTLSGNSADYGGGGFYAGGDATVAGSTLSGNSADYGGGFWASGALTVTDSTLSGNSASDNGGGFYAEEGATVAGSTLSGNGAVGDGGGFWAEGGATVTNSVFATGASGANCSAGNAIVDNGGVVSSDATCVNGGAGSLANADPRLAPLADYGGPTATHAPRGDSPARGAGAAADCAARPADQRGVARPATGCDSGAYQSVPVAVAPAALPGGTVGAAYQAQLTADGGAAPQTFAVTAGALPGGLALAAGGALGGTPTAAGTARFTVTATDALGATGSRAYSVTVAAAPSPSPPPSPVARAIVTAAATGGGTVSPAGATGYAAGALGTYTATPDRDALFLGWTLDGRAVGFANPLDFTVDADRALVAMFAPRPAFADVAPSGVAWDAITQLAARGVINGYGDGRFGPGDGVLRAQVAALIVRAFGWDTADPHGPAPFGDSGGVDPELQRAIAILAQRGIITGYGDGTFGPTDEVKHAQVISFITRAMVQAGYWTAVTQDDASLYPNVPLRSGHRLDLLTFAAHAGAVPDRPAGGDWADWATPASRGWTAHVIWRALGSEFGVDRVP